MRTHSFELATLALPLLCTASLAQAPGAHWTMTSTPTDPPLRRENPGAADLGHMYVFGGQAGGSGGAALNDLWRFDGTDWTLMTADGAVGSPPARARAGVTWNFARNRLMVFGGDDAAGTSLGDTWEWDPNTNSWADATPVGVSPSARRYTALAYDYANAKVLLFGGVDASGTHLDDSWHFDGVAWIPLTPASPRPDARRQHVLVERADQLDILLCGGQDTSTGALFGDTWTWNGSSWTQVPTAGAPAGKVAIDAAYDWQRGRVVIAGGNPGPTGQISEFDSDLADWVIRPLDDGIKKVTRYFMAYVPAHGKTYKVGGQSLNPTVAPPEKTYEYQSDYVATLTGSGVGCPGTAGQPALVFTGKPWLGASVSIDVTNAAATELVFMLSGFGTASWLGSPLPLDLTALGAPGCLLYLAPDFQYTQSLGTGPAPAPFAVTIPSTPNFLGYTLYHQAFLVDAGTFAFGGTGLATSIIGTK